jgi:hypothetical protein
LIWFFSSSRGNQQDASKQDKTEQVPHLQFTNLTRCMTYFYAIGAALIYAFIIKKLFELDYAPRSYVAYLAALLGAYLAARWFAAIQPRRPDVWALPLALLVVALIHLGVMTFQYTFGWCFGDLGKEDLYLYFLKDVIVLVMMTAFAVLALDARRGEKSTRSIC